MPTPLLILSDAPTSGTGLGRITRDLATRIHRHLPDKFRVGTLGYGGPFSRALGFPQYNLDMKDWVAFNLPEVWQDFAGDEHGAVLTIWDASRLLWFSRPENCPEPRLKQFLEAATFERWGYFPMDATGPHDRLTHVLSHTINNYDRVLAYSKWAMDILERSLDPNDLDLDWRPHGIDTTVFYPRPRIQARHGFGQRIGARNVKGKFLSIPDDAFFIGIVATNQVRKDYGLGIQTVAEIRKHRPVFLWIHTDTLERHWSLACLINDFDLADVTVVTTVELSDDQMAWCYSACDVTLGIGAGEGFGYPIFESWACGTPCVHGDYGGAAEHIHDWAKVEPDSYRLEGLYDCYRPVFCGDSWVSTVKRIAEKEFPSEEYALPPYLSWDKLWPSWEEWLVKGLK